MNEQLQHKSTTWQTATQALLLKQTAIKQQTTNKPTPKPLDTKAAPPTQTFQRKRIKYQLNTTS
jgi:hypothetical protein